MVNSHHSYSLAVFVFSASNMVVVVVQWLNPVWLFATSWTTACQASHPTVCPGVCSDSCPLSHWCSLTISSSTAPFSFYLQSFPTSGPFPMSWLFTSVDQNVGTSASASALPMNIQSWFPLVRIDWFYLLAIQGTLKSLLQHHNSKESIFLHSVQLSHPYMTTGKTIALTRWTLFGKVMSLLFTMRSWLVIAFLPRSKRL